MACLLLSRTPPAAVILLYRVARGLMGTRGAGGWHNLAGSVLQSLAAKEEWNLERTSSPIGSDILSYRLLERHNSMVVSCAATAVVGVCRVQKPCLLYLGAHGRAAVAVPKIDLCPVVHTRRHRPRRY